MGYLIIWSQLDYSLNLLRYKCRQVSFFTFFATNQVLSKLTFLTTEQALLISLISNPWRFSRLWLFKQSHSSEDLVFPIFNLIFYSAQRVFLSPQHRLHLAYQEFEVEGVYVPTPHIHPKSCPCSSVLEQRGRKLMSPYVFISWCRDVLAALFVHANDPILTWTMMWCWLDCFSCFLCCETQ